MKMLRLLPTLLLSGAFVIGAILPMRAAESWVSDPKTGTKIGWISDAATLLAASWSGGSVAGKAQGKGNLTATLRNKDGDVSKIQAVAEMTAGKLDGKVSLKWSYGETFDGLFKNGLREGRGITKFPNGTIHDFEWKNGVKDGHAISKYASGESFEGEMKNDQFSKGLYRWADGSTYEGEWKDNRRTGKGLRKWPNGQSYAGDFKNGRADGKGIFKYINGASYEGEFFDDRPGGKGVLKDPQGAVIFSGERQGWQDESMQAFIGPGEYQSPASLSAPSRSASPAITAAEPASTTSPPKSEVLMRETNISSDATLLRELRERLYELNFDPAVATAPFSEADRRAILEFEEKNSLPQTGAATSALLGQLRAASGRSPWGAIVFAKSSAKWGMAWGHASRKEAVASAVSSCGDPRQCTVELSFFGSECGAFAYSGTNWSLVARANSDQAKEAALADCQKGGRNCRVIALVCANGSDRRQAGSRN